MKNGLRLSLLAIALVGCGWYLLKPADYQVNMQVNALEGTIEQTFLGWAETLDAKKFSTTPGEFYLEMTRDSATYRYRWEITEQGDGMSAIRVYVSSPEHNILDRLRLPFTETALEKESETLLKDFLGLLTTHLKEFRMNFEGSATLPARYCACVETHTSQKGKAWGMMKNYPLLSGVLNASQLNGRPFLAVRKWDRETHKLVYDFCYPVRRSDSLPTHPEIFYKNFPSQPALKAIYNGNYITSDRAWYLLEQKAAEQDIQNYGLPMEVFHNNPNMGGNEMGWTAEIYLPLGKKG